MIKSIVPYKHHNSRSRTIREVLLTSPLVEEQRSKLANLAYKKIATMTEERLHPKGGAPEFEAYDNFENNKEYYDFQKGKGNGKGSGGNSSGKSRQSRSQKFSKMPSKGDSGLRGYQENPGVDCLQYNSGISSGLTVNTRILGKDYSPMFLSSGLLFIRTDQKIEEDTVFINQLTNIIYPFIESRISIRIQRYAGQYIKSSDFVDYLFAVAEALQYYYCIDNVLTYCSNVSYDNINVGMERCRELLSAETVVNFNLLKETLMLQSVPRNLLDYIRFMCQSYRTSDAPHSSIIKLNIGGMFDENWSSGNYSHLSSKLQSLRYNIINNSKMSSYLLQAFPEWNIGVLPASSNKACFNKEFFTFWHNQNCCYLSTDSSNIGNFDYTQITENLDSYTDYQILQRDTDVDGVIFISTNYVIKVPDKDKFSCYWGVWHPLASISDKTIPNGDPRQTFNIKCLTSNGFYSVINPIILGQTGIHWLIVYSGPPGNYLATRSEFGTHGFVKLQNSSVRMQTEAFNNSMRLWFI